MLGVIVFKLVGRFFYLKYLYFFLLYFEWLFKFLKWECIDIVCYVVLNIFIYNFIKYVIW